MKSLLPFLLFALFSLSGVSKAKTIHVFVALCDNQNQGIVPVPESLGNGQDPRSNLYWGAMYGVKSFFKYKAQDWTLVKVIKSNDSKILERVLFKNASQEAYLLADAYDGYHIKACTEAFLKASNHQNPTIINHEGIPISFGGKSDLIAYCGHDGLMEFDVDINYNNASSKKPIIALACYSKEFFGPELKECGANPLVLTTGLMAPEAYTLKAAIDGWLQDETFAEIKERAAQAYNKYQKCGMRGARGLFTSTL